MDKKALDSIGKEPRPGQAECHLLIVVNTQHLLGEEPSAEHNGEHGIYADAYAYGWHLALTEDMEPDEPWAQQGLKNIAQYARLIGATHVRVDDDGPVVTKIPHSAPIAEDPLLPIPHGNYDSVRCPLCKHEHTMEAGSVELQDEYAYRPVECSRCGATWDEQMDVTGYTNLRDEEGNEIEIPE